MIKITKITKKQAEVFNKYFAEDNNVFPFEGMWLRNQDPKNINQSDYIDETTVRRRYIHFYDHYVVLKEKNKYYLAIEDSYLVVSNTLPKDEIEAYKAKIINSLQVNGYVLENDKYLKDDFVVLLFPYKDHPKNQLTNIKFPENYESFDVIFKTKNMEWQQHYDRMWNHSTKMFRKIEEREEPTYTTNLDKLKQYLPAQVEMGCGPSIEVNIPPLYDMHETYRVQNHINKKFYFGEEDTLLVDIINNPYEMFKKFARVPIACISAKHSKAYLTFAKAYKEGLFIGTVYNNNFDRLVKRFDIDEYILRIYDRQTYLPKIKFHKEAKSLIVFGSHADRREVQKQAREQGLKVIHVDPEGFYEKNKFVKYPLEAPKDEDLIYKMTFTQFMKKFKKEIM